MKYLILLCFGAATLMACASVDGTVTQTTADTPNADHQASAQMVTVSPALAHQLYTQGKLVEAFDMNYVLATRGDDRSQYNIGVSYHNGVEGRVKRDYAEAYAWMIASETVTQEPTRTAGLHALKDRLSDEQQHVARERAAVLVDLYGSGNRVPSNLESITSLEDASIPSMPCSYLGTRIERECQGARSFRGRGELQQSPITGPSF
jgi:hypothetical protein